MNPLPATLCGANGFSSISYYGGSTSSGPVGGNLFNCFVGYVMDWTAFSTAPTGNTGVNRSGLSQFSAVDLAFGAYSAIGKFGGCFGSPGYCVTLLPSEFLGLGRPSILPSLTPSIYGGTTTSGDAYGTSPTGPKISCPTGQHPLIGIGAFPVFSCVPNLTPITPTTVVSSSGTLTNTLATSFGMSSIGGTHPTGNTLLPTPPPGGVQIIVPCFLSFPGLPCSP